MVHKKEERRKPYEKPTATRLTAEEAKLKLVVTSVEATRARKIPLEIIFPEDAKRLSIRKKKPA